MKRWMTCLLALGLLFSACSSAEDESYPPDLEPPEIELNALSTCEQLEDAVQAEVHYLRYCRQDADCGTPLPRTSCGCTRNLVARAGADTTRFYALLDRGSAMQCPLGFASTCDCPPADGFACVENQCTWDYTDATP